MNEIVKAFETEILEYDRDIQEGLKLIKDFEKISTPEDEEFLKCAKQSIKCHIIKYNIHKHKLEKIKREMNEL